MRATLHLSVVLVLIGMAICSSAQSQETAFDFLQGTDGQLLFTIEPTNDPIHLPGDRHRLNHDHRSA